MQPGLYKRTMKLMGNRFEITVVAFDESWAEACIHDAVTEIQRIETLLTTFQDNSETNQVNRMAGIQPVEVSAEMLQLVSRSVKLSKLTQGAFDITYGSVDKRFWNFDTTMQSLPDKATAAASVRLINYRNIVINEEQSTLFLKEKGMRIGFGGIGKGYAAERAKAVLQQKGVTSGIVNASGDLTTWGTQPDGHPWTVGIANPDIPHQLFSSLTISGMAIATSGNYEKYVVIDGKKYSHTIDPSTGMPVQGIKSVSILCPNAEMADAMATPVMIMGIKAGLHMINQIKGMACLIINDHNQLFTSANIRLQ
ncbi:thiamine biosynthesis lipoprotein [Filimonas lacunae]|uniref:FAD:protein FMN transferase n=2 Tax=Filimonas lacunae TaxID=477680 RepID=A0A173MHG5_9BACT|nr:thiamin biosynthesis lipoprotein ApbE [Filimonas lacunae]SIS98582.1 thiamine biosynthesis lipoprotein [Filimonas lacunae]